MGIEERTREAGKTYAFCEDHEKGSLAQYWFQHPPEGLTLFVVFYTQACQNVLHVTFLQKCRRTMFPSRIL